MAPILLGLGSSDESEPAGGSQIIPQDSHPSRAGASALFWSGYAQRGGGKHHGLVGPDRPGTPQKHHAEARGLKHTGIDSLRPQDGFFASQLDVVTSSSRL